MSISKTRSPWRVIIFKIIILVSFAVLVTQAFYRGMVIRKYKVYSEKLGSDVRILVISDLHSCEFGDKQENLMNEIEEIDPDLIFLPGDIVDDYLPQEPAEELFSQIGNTYRCYYVTGNHELWTHRADEIKEMIRGYGITVLEGDCDVISVAGNELNICGIDDPYSKAENVQLRDAFSEIDTDRYTILLAHRPERDFKYDKYPCDLVVSGHAHGGQWRLPGIIEGVYAPNQGWFPKYTGGMFVYEDHIHIISRGLALNYTTPRIFNPPELTVIDISGKHDMK